MNELAHHEQVSLLLAGHQRRLMGYLYALVSNRHEAEELLQEVNLYICQHGEEFARGTDFAAWAMKIAYFRVLSWRKRRSSQQLVFDDELLAKVADAAQSFDDVSDRRLDALESCLKKLPGHESQLIAQLYSAEEEVSPQHLAQRLGRSPKGIYATLSRIRGKLFDCIRRTLAAEEASR